MGRFLEVSASQRARYVCIRISAPPQSVLPPLRWCVAMAVVPLAMLVLVAFQSPGQPRGHYCRNKAAAALDQPISPLSPTRQAAMQVPEVPKCPGWRPQRAPKCHRAARESVGEGKNVRCPGVTACGQSEKWAWSYSTRSQESTDTTVFWVSVTVPVPSLPSAASLPHRLGSSSHHRNWKRANSFILHDPRNDHWTPKSTSRSTRTARHSLLNTNWPVPCNLERL
jgi:hypothetical protein